MTARLYADANGARGAKIGSDSAPSAIAPSALTTNTAGQSVTFDWAGGCPTIPSGAFWLNIVRGTAAGGQVNWKSGPDGSSGGAACGGGTTYDGWWTGSSVDLNQDFAYTIYTTPACAGP